MLWVGSLASGIFFNYWGVTHELELELWDSPNVWRAIVDGSQVVFFEADSDAGAIELMNCAIDAWLVDGLNG